jgi:HK97 family phage prohead protease
MPDEFLPVVELSRPDPFESHLEVRDIEKREIVGRIVPYGERITVRGRPESFAMGALAGVPATSIKLLSFHDKNRPVGKSVALEEREDGAYAVFRVSKTREGDEMLELAADGVLSLSPGFLTGVQTPDGVHRRVKAMPEVSLVTFSAYEGSQVLAVREEAVVPDEIVTTDPVVETREVDLGPLETRMDDLFTKLEEMKSIVDAPPIRAPKGGPTPFDWFGAQIETLTGRSMEKREKLAEDWSDFQTRAAAGEFETRALADITGVFPEPSPAVDVSGLVVEEYVASQLVNVLDRRRPLFASLGSFPMSRSGNVSYPVVTQGTVVSNRPTQKEQAASQKMIITTRDAKAEWLSGAVDVALEIIATAELPVLQLVWDDLLGQYAKATEHDSVSGVVPLVEAGGLGFTYTGVALPTNTYAAFIAALEAQVDVVDDATGLPPTALAVTRAQWAALIAMVDGNDRRLFSSIGAQNADAVVGLTARSFELPGGITVFKVKGLTQAMLYDSGSLKAADSGPQRVEATNVALMGRDIGLIGRTLLVNRIPTGVVVFGTDPDES